MGQQEAAGTGGLTKQPRATNVGNTRLLVGQQCLRVVATDKWSVETGSNAASLLHVGHA